jgi:hypothetical protein
MAISTVTVLQSMEFCKRFSYNRPSAIGNYLEPAKTAANFTMQTILGPPFRWWWNSQELTFTASQTAASANTTGNVVIAGGVLTLTVTSAFAINQLLLLSGFTTVTQLNGQSIVVLTNTGTVITANINLPNVSSTADAGVVTAATNQDYTLAVPQFSHIETASVLDISKTPAKWMGLTNKSSLSLEANIARPEFIEAYNQDAAGNVTFRLLPAPNLAYPVSIHTQNAAPLITSLNQTWAPIPDYLQYIYNYGFLSLMWAFADDPRFQWANQKFITHLLGRADGLTALERNIFLNRWDDLTGRQNLDIQQGVSARGGS